MSNSGNNKSNMSNHIFPTSSNLLGLCFVILSFIKVSKFGAETLIDEIAAVAMVFFLTSSILSYASIRSNTKSEVYEKTADIIFLVGLFLLAVVSVTVAFEVIH